MSCCALIYRLLPSLIILAILTAGLTTTLPAPPPAYAQVGNGLGFASAVPCLSSTPTFATTSMANTILSNGAQATASDPALLQLTSTTHATLAPIGTSTAVGQNSRITNGLGATNGLAYDDGSISGIRRLFVAAYLKRSVGLGSAGLGAIYEYRFASGSWSLATTVPNVGSENRPPADINDSAMADQVGIIGLGDLEVSPDGQTLYAMNLSTRQIERYDISAGTLIRQSPLSIPLGIINTDPAVQADLRPFALGFWPVVNPALSIRPPLMVGLVDSGARSIGAGTSPRWPTPMAYVLAATNAGSGSWSIAIAQNLRASEIVFREASSTFLPRPRDPAQMDSWNPWAPLWIARIARSDHHVRFPEPLLTDITVTHDGQTLYMGLRDRIGDQMFSTTPPANEDSVMSQGDVLTYKLIGGVWVLQGDQFGDFFDDNTHQYLGMPTATPAHTENFMGAAAIQMGGVGPSGFTEQLMTTSLLGAFASGARTYSTAGGAITSEQTLHTAGTPAGGKAATLGDVEVLCSYALIGGRVWQDSDGNGIQNLGEPAFPHVALEVAEQIGVTAPPLASLTTDTQGRYLFAVPPNTPVFIRIAASNRTTLAAQGWRFTDPNLGGDDTHDSDAGSVDGAIEMSGQNYGTVGGGITGMAVPMPMNRSDQRTLDLGLTRTTAVGQIGDWVWDDTNHDGLQGTGELGHPGIQVTLTPDPTSAALLPGSYPQVTTTDSNGRYRFSNLPPGRYRVTFGTPLAPFSATLRNQGGNDATDSDVDITTGYASPYITIMASPNQINTSIDFGLYGGTPDVWIIKSGPAQALVGNALSYTLDYGNAGALPAAGVILVDTLPAGVSYVSASPAPSSVSGQTIRWSLGALATGQTGRITLNVRAPASLGAATSQLITNQANISTTSANDPPGNNASASASTVVRPEVSINLTMPANILVGDEFNSSLSYANSGSIAAANVAINTTLPVGVTLTRFIQNPSAACSYTAATRRIGCSFASLAAGTSGSVIFAAQANVTTAASIATTATISTATAGDTATNNTSTVLTTVQFPNPSVTIGLSPSPVPVGTSGTISVPYRNTGTGIARNAVLTITLPAGIVLGTLPGGCSYTAATRALTCGLGDLAAGVSGTRAISFSLPATFPADQLDVSATISSTTPERSLDQANNTANTTTNVVRPNVFVSAAGPASIVGQGSAFWYTVGYGNHYQTNPALTRAAAGVVLQATLPPDVTLVQVDLPPSSVSGQTLSWNLGSLAANAGGQIHIVVQTHVPAGASLHFSANIATSTIGDDPSDNYATTDTTVVQPPSAVSQADGSLRVAIHSDLDPNSQDTDALNGVYESAGPHITWPAGEVLDITPRLDGVDFPDEPLPFPYEYRARVVGWSIAGVNINGVTHNPQAVDSRGMAGCRAGAHPNTAPERLIGCAYAYLGGEDRDAIDHPGPINESQLASQAHLYWTQPPAPRMRNDVYLFTLDPIEAVQLAIQVEIEVWIVNTAPGSIGGIALPEIPVVPLPDPERQLISQAVNIDLLVPRSVIAPGS